MQCQHISHPLPHHTSGGFPVIQYADDTLLFVLAADMLQTILNQAMQCQHISHPLPHHASGGFPVIQYVDDTLIIMHAELTQIRRLKDLLSFYNLYTGLKINYHTSTMVPINADES